MTVVLVVAEVLLLARLVVTTEFLRRPCFAIFLIVSIYSATHYSLDRQAWLTQAVYSDIAKGLVLIEAFWWMCQRDHLFVVLGWALGFGVFPAALIFDLPTKMTAVYGAPMMWNTFALTYIASGWTFAVLYVSGRKWISREGGRVRAFDWILAVYLWVLPVTGWRLYFQEGGKNNPEWPLWQAASMEILIGCMILWLITPRLLGDFKQQATAEQKQEYRRLLKNQGKSRHRLSRQPQSSS